MVQEYRDQYRSEDPSQTHIPAEEQPQEEHSHYHDANHSGPCDHDHGHGHHAEYCSDPNGHAHQGTPQGHGHQDHEQYQVHAH